MTPFTSDLLLILCRDLRCLAKEVGLYPDDASLWRTLPGLANSGGNVALHVAGNLRYFVGATFGATRYVRQREQEFAQREGRREEVRALLEATILDVETGLRALTPEQLAAPFPAPLMGLHPPTSRVLLHLAAHLAFHLGQVGYLRRALTGDATSGGGMAIQHLVVEG